MFTNFFGNGNSMSGIGLTFDEAIDASSFAVEDAIVTGPDGLVDVTGVTQLSPTQFNVWFAEQPTSGVYTVVVGVDILDLAGNPMNQNIPAPNGEIPADQFMAQWSVSGIRTYNSTDVNKLIADFRRTTSTLTITDDFLISDISVTLNLSHTYDSDLRITLVGPDGTQVVLVDRRGGSGNNFTNTVLDDEASVTIADGRAPFTGVYRPESLLSAFDGKSMQGTWTLWIDDLARADFGRINAWSVTMRY